MQKITAFSSANFHLLCDTLAAADNDLAQIIRLNGYPPMWTRPNTFETLIHIILEQQVSLASALATLNKLRERITEVTPARLLMLTDEELRACYFSRQKTSYARYLAEAVLGGAISLAALEELPDDEIRSRLSTLKGIGNWTIDVYLMFVLQRANVFPVGDLAAVNALKQVKALPKDTSREEILAVAASWQPYRTVATMILWHHYLSVRTRKQG
ncbi:DNA-3-methyladenine glycosylase family protein [Hufsiella ginkgonis]|uniref:DNA-3-methyladenine glycosylase II n=1 Tax=Hufsiella ginkgonis TaxID=2695274 RepID=A0A7K1XYL0_9SPHI|nr:DNA-3-methyladenine glycosylase 2 family protein [Hufsiella ginkgonis]MXV15636.1 DNA-3-methyladenine glycosylase 2 family protein [Hufsiella ginkgonis]